MKHRREQQRQPGRISRTATTTAALVLLTACTASTPGQQMAPVDRVLQQGVRPEATDALLRSTFRLGAAMTTVPASNQVTSPLGALYAVSMLRAGAGTTTAAEMDAVLGLPAEHHEAMNALLARVQYFDGDPGSVDEEDPPGKPVLHLANAVFVPEGGTTGEGYLETLARHYGAGVHPVDFADPSTPARIDDWVSAETGGRITKAPIEVGAGTTLSLLNTVYFAAAWDEPFDPSGTVDQDFVLADGSSVDVPMMHGTRTVRHVQAAGWTGIDLPYGEGFSMRLILPAEGSPPEWTGQELLDMALLFDAAEDVRVDLALPTWDHAFEQDLLGPLTAIGLEESFGPDPDFRRIQPGSFVAGAAQAANITVAEKGTIAAAVTQLTMMASAPAPPELSVTFDRPFGYQIIHEDTGLPLFLGTVADPR